MTGVLEDNSDQGVLLKMCTTRAGWTGNKSMLPRRCSIVKVKFWFKYPEDTSYNQKESELE